MFRKNAPELIFRKDAKAQRVESLAEAPVPLSFTSWLSGFLIHPLLCAFASLRETLLPVLMLLFCSSAFAAHPADAPFNAANALYDKGDFKGAQAIYEGLVESGTWSANLFYNLGNAAFRQGDKAAAFLAYERSLALEPGQPEAQANLRFLRDQTGAKLPPISWQQRALGWPSANAAAWIAAATFFGLALSLLPKTWNGRIFASPAIFCALALAWSAAVLAWDQSRGETWIVTSDHATARTTPADSSPAAAILPMGSQVRLLQERGAWLHIQLPDASKAWISADAVKPVRLGRSKP
jgi:tetratricopeptide (TPR) repeat protein